MTMWCIGCVIGVSYSVGLTDVSSSFLFPIPSAAFSHNAVTVGASDISDNAAYFRLGNGSKRSLIMDKNAHQD